MSALLPHPHPGHGLVSLLDVGVLGLGAWRERRRGALEDLAAEPSLDDIMEGRA